jgi:hypothetical protein
MALLMRMSVDELTGRCVDAFSIDFPVNASTRLQNKIKEMYDEVRQP